MTSELALCQWPHCPRRVRPEHLLCPRHWCRLPEEVRQRLDNACRPGLEASPEYAAAAHDALAYAFAAEASARGEPTG